MLPEAIAHVEPCPCEDCPQKQLCTEQALACYVYYKYLKFGLTIQYERKPTKEMFKRANSDRKCRHGFNDLEVVKEGAE